MGEIVTRTATFLGRLHFLWAGLNAVWDWSSIGVGERGDCMRNLVSLRATSIWWVNDFIVSHSSSYIRVLSWEDRAAATNMLLALCAKRLRHSWFQPLVSGSDHARRMRSGEGRELLSSMKLITSCVCAQPGRVGEGSPFFLARIRIPSLFRKCLKSFCKMTNQKGTRNCFIVYTRGIWSCSVVSELVAWMIQVIHHPHH